MHLATPVSLSSISFLKTCSFPASHSSQSQPSVLLDPKHIHVAEDRLCSGFSDNQELCEVSCPLEGLLSSTGKALGPIYPEVFSQEYSLGICCRSRELVFGKDKYLHLHSSKHMNVWKVQGHNYLLR